MNRIENFNYASRLAPKDQSCQAELLKKLKSTPAALLDKILMLHNKYGIVFPNQTTLGKAGDVGRIQANRVIKILFELGLIEKCYRSNLTCIYRPAAFLLDPKIRMQFKHKFQAFKWFSLIMLFAGLISENVTRTIPAIKNFSSVSETMYLTSVYNVSNCISKKRSFHKMYSTPERSQLILQLTDRMGLNKLGQFKLSPYPIEALQYALDKLDAVIEPQNMRSVFLFFVKLCNEWCDTNSMAIDWKTSFKLMEEHGLDRNGNVYQTQKQPRIENKQGNQKWERSSKSTPQSQPVEYQTPERKTYKPMSELRKPEYRGILDQDMPVDDPRFLAAVVQPKPEIRDDLISRHSGDSKFRPLLDILTGKKQPESDKLYDPRPEEFNLRKYLAKHASPDIPRAVAASVPISGNHFGDGSPITDYAAYDDGVEE